MPRKYDELLAALADGTGEVVEQTMNDYLNPPPTNQINDPIDCVNEIGQTNGFVEGEADFYASTIGAFQLPGDPMVGYPEAFAVCDGIVEPISAEINIPSFGNPLVTFGEVLLTPTEANAGEAEALTRQAMPEAYGSGYDTGYLAGGIDAFDATLADKLTIQFGVSAPVANEPMPMNSPAAAIDYHATIYDAPPAYDPPPPDRGSGGSGSDGGSGSSE